MNPEQVLESLNIGFFTLKQDYSVGYWNRWLENNTSIARRQIIGKSIFQFFPYLRRQELTSKIESIFHFGHYVYYSQKIHNFLLAINNPFPAANGFKQMQQNVTMGPLRDSDNNIKSIFVSITDVTDIASKEVELRKSTGLLASIIDDQSELVCRFLPDGTLTFVNDSFCRYLSRSRESIIGTSAYSFIFKRDWKLMLKTLKSFTPSNPMTNVEFRVVLDETGQTRWQNWTGKAFFDSKGAVSECQAVGRDITQQKLADEELGRNREALEKKVEERAGELKRSEAMYRGLFNASRDGLVIVDSQGMIKDINPEFLGMVGYAGDGLLGVAYSMCLADGWLPVQDKIIKDQVIGQGYSDIYEVEYTRADGSVFPASVRSYVTSNDPGMIMHNVRDITAQKESLEERARILSELEGKVKHFRCLYVVSASIKMSASLEEMFGEAAYMLKNSMQHPEQTCVRISAAGTTYSSPDFRETPWGTRSEILVAGAEPGYITISLLQEPAPLEKAGYAYASGTRDKMVLPDTYPFSREEAELADMVAFMIGEDIEHRGALDALNLSHEKLKAMAMRLENVEELERTRIANELHDQIGQKLAFLKISIGRLKNSMPGGPDAAFDRVGGLLDEIIRDSRTLMLDISPSVLFEFGFMESIEWLADQYRDKHGMDIRVTSALGNGDVPVDLYMLLFKSVREALNNVLKHAEATMVSVDMRMAGASVRVLVQDNGRGFNPGGSAGLGSVMSGFGLFNIKQNLGQVGGAMSIESGMGKGTSVIIKIPQEGRTRGEH